MSLIDRRSLLGAGVSSAGLPWVAHAQPDAVRLSLTEWLGRDWRNERVSFALGREAAALRSGAAGIVDSSGRPTPFEVLPDGRTIELLVDLPAFSRLDFEVRAGAPTARSDLAVRTTSDLIILENGLGRFALRSRLAGLQGPIAGLDRGNGVWIGASRLDVSDAVVAYDASVQRRGPVAATVVCSTRMRSGVQWDLRATLQAGDPAVLVEERWSQWRHAEVTLDFARDFQPDSLYFRKGAPDTGPGGGLGAVALEAIDGAPGATEFEIEPWLHWWISKRRGNWFAATGTARPGALIVAALRSDLWITPDDVRAGRQLATLRAVRSQGGFDLVLPDEGKRRCWLVAMLPPAAIDATLVGRADVAPPPQALVIKHGDFPLDRVKDQVLAWPTSDRPYSRMVLSRGDLEALRAAPAYPSEAGRLRGRQLDEFSLKDFLRHRLVTGDPDTARRLSREAQPALQRAVDVFLHQGRLVTMGMAPHWQREILYAAHLADAAFADDVLTADERARLRAQAAFLAYTVARPDYWSPGRGFAANPNMTSMVAGYQGFLACLLWDHPLAPSWLQSSLTEMFAELLGWSDEQGGWLEAPHYAMGSYDFILGVAICARNRGRPELFDHPRLRRVLEWFAKITTPPDPRLAGARHLPPIGNTYLLEATSQFGLAAYLWRTADPALSARLEWMHRASGSPARAVVGGACPALDPYRSILIDPALPETQPAYGSELFSKTGAVLRSHFGTDRETQLLIIAGTNHAHYDYDSGAVTIWGKGRRIADDFGYYGRAPRSDHSMVDSDGDAAVLQIDTFETTALADYLRGRSGGWSRQVVFVKSPDPLGPNYYVIRDRLDAGKDGTWRLWFSGRVNLDGMQATVVGDEDVDAHVALFGDRPLNLRLETISRTSVSGPFDKSLATTQTAIVAPMGADGCTLTVVIYPHLKASPPPQCRGGQDRLCIGSGADEDTLELAEGGSTLADSAVGVVLRRRDGVHAITFPGAAVVGGLRTVPMRV